jgi:transcriptional regulator with XRE-family HTH domain
MDLTKIFVHNMKTFRKKAGISQEALAGLCDASHSYIRQIECGSKFPSFGFIGKLATALGIPPSHLFYDENETEKFEATLKEKIEAELIGSIVQNVHTAFTKL